MGKAPEPSDDFQMTLGIVGRKVVGRPFAQKLNGQPLMFDVLRMLEGQVAEHAVIVCRVGLVEAQSQNVPRDRQSLWIGGEGLRRSTKDVAGHLVEQDAQRQRAVRLVLPVIQAAFGRAGIEVD